MTFFTHKPPQGRPVSRQKAGLFGLFPIYRLIIKKGYAIDQTLIWFKLFIFFSLETSFQAQI
jgi:hypothetical protein